MTESIHYLRTLRMSKVKHVSKNPPPQKNWNNSNSPSVPCRTFRCRSSPTKLFKSVHSILLSSEAPYYSDYMSWSSVTKVFTSLLFRDCQEKWAAHKLALALRDTCMHKHALASHDLPRACKALLILKQELNNGLHSSQVTQTPHCFCCPVRRIFITVTD